MQEQEQHRTTIAYKEICSPFIHAPKALSCDRPIVRGTKWPEKKWFSDNGLLNIQHPNPYPLKKY